jgi:hypothetical protein
MRERKNWTGKNEDEHVLKKEGSTEREMITHREPKEMRKRGQG